MLINIFCAKCIGIQAVPVTVEVDINSGIGIHLVGLADVAVKESLLRTMTALQSIGFRIPGKKIVINLAPADMRKNGSGYDLPIALGIIAASGQCDLPALDKYVIMGELGLDATIRGIPGALPIAEYASAAGFEGCIFPEESALEAAELGGTRVFGVKTISDVLRILEDKEDVSDLLVTGRNVPQAAKTLKDYMDFADIVGQDGAKRGLEIAAAGGHNVIMVGSPGSGKTSLAKAMIGIMPRMQTAEAIETSKIYSVAGLRTATLGLMRERPFRAPHYSASMAAIIGGGNGENILPGEVSLAENGVLFLDEFAQMPRNITEALRGPLEDRKVVISRLRSKVEFPASFMLVAASNPCPCGYYGVKGKCTCTPSQRQAYMGRLSGPIMDRIDIQLTMRPVPPEDMVRRQRSEGKDNACQCETSAEIARRVLVARKIQQIRFAGTDVHVNAGMTGEMLGKFCRLSDECAALMEKMSNRLGLSARAFSRVLKLSRTIADLEDAAAMVSSGCRMAGHEDTAGESGFDAMGYDAITLPASYCESPIAPHHILESFSYRFLDRLDR